MSTRGAHFRWTLLLILALAVSPGVTAEPTPLTGAALESEGIVRLPATWRYHPDAASELSAPEVDDRAWVEVDSRLRKDAMPADWSGAGWFRQSLRAEADLVGVVLALRVGQRGASEIYLDGELVAAFGETGLGGGKFVPRVASPRPTLVFDRAGDHLLAIRYFNPDGDAYHRIGWGAGFEIDLGLAERVAGADNTRTRRAGLFIGLFGGVFLAFAGLHLVLFLFNRDRGENADFALLSLLAAVLAVLLELRALVPDPRLALISEPVMNLLGPPFALLALRLVSRLFGTRPTPWTWVVAGVAILVAVWGFLFPGAAQSFVFLAMLVVFAEIFRTTLVAVWRRKPGARIVGLGLLLFAAGFSFGLLSLLGVLPVARLTTTTIPFLSVVALLAAMSIQLSRQFAETSKRLQSKLHEVEDLSEQKLAQERLARGEEVKRRLLEAEVKRKTDELEEARQLQLAMLPIKPPERDDVEIAAFMQTATEVGGDYYDFDVDPDGTLTMVIGDATGHGMRAGTMVTATKSLFGALKREGPVAGVLGRAGSALRGLGLRRLAMALQILRLREGEVRLASAGMPPLFVFRSDRGQAESILFEGLPLGALKGAKYEEYGLELARGDVVLLYSDGFPERLNPAGEMLGYDRAEQAFLEFAREPPTVLVERLAAAGDAWSEGRPPDDDITFVALRML